MGVSLRYSQSIKDVKHRFAGDPLQTVSSNIKATPVSAGIKQVLLFASRSLVLIGDSPLKPAVCSNPDADRYPDQPVIAAGTVGKCRIVVPSDLLWVQPFRIGKYDNAQLLLNTLEFLLDRKISPEFRKEFVTDNILFHPRINLLVMTDSVPVRPAAERLLSVFRRLAVSTMKSAG